MLRYIVIVFLMLPFLDFYLLMKVAESVGLLEAVVFSIATGVIGASLIKREGRYVLQKLQRSVTGAEVTRNFLGGFILVASGIMLVTPGFLTDIIGAVAAFRPVRERIVAKLTDRMSNNVEIQFQTF